MQGRAFHEPQKDHLRWSFEGARLRSGALDHSRRITAQLKLLPFKQNVAVFLWFPQRNSVLHSLFTTRHQFSVAALSLFKQSIASANVRCLERYGLQ
jgi:hypothetical protein